MYVQYGFRSSQSTVDDGITRAVNRSGATRVVVLDISKTFNSVWHAGLLHKLKLYGIWGRVFNLNSSFLSDRRLRVFLDGKPSQGWSFPRLYSWSCSYSLVTFLVIFFVILLSILMILHSEQASDLWQMLELASKHESDHLWDNRLGQEVACWFQC